MSKKYYSINFSYNRECRLEDTAIKILKFEYYTIKKNGRLIKFLQDRKMY